MQYLIPFVDWANGAIMMTVIFGLVIFGLVGYVMYFINSAGKKEQDKKSNQV
jgi:flagellar basal body-associated protein FliL